LSFSCEDETLVTDETADKFVTAGDFDQRSSTLKDLIWLDEFQEHLQSIQNGNNNNSIYTAEDAAFGIEWLFNYSLADNIIGLSKEGEISTFDITTDNNWLDLYNLVESQVNDEISSKSHLEFNFLSMTLLEAENKIELETNFKLVTPEITDYLSTANAVGSINCDNPPFMDDANFFFGSDGENGDVQFPCNPDFFNPCREEEGACETPRYFGLEMVEAFTNAGIKNPLICKGDNQMISFSNVTTLYNFQPLELFQALQDCDPEVENNIYACTCIGSETLNCLFCLTEDLILNTEAPEGLTLIDIDLYTLDITFGNADYYMIELTYAQVDCVPQTISMPPIDIIIECC